MSGQKKYHLYHLSRDGIKRPCVAMDGNCKLNGLADIPSEFTKGQTDIWVEEMNKLSTEGSDGGMWGTLSKNTRSKPTSPASLFPVGFDGNEKLYKDVESMIKSADMHELDSRKVMAALATASRQHSGKTNTGTIEKPVRADYAKGNTFTLADATAPIPSVDSQLNQVKWLLESGVSDADTLAVAALREESTQEYITKNKGDADIPYILNELEDRAAKDPSLLMREYAHLEHSVNGVGDIEAKNGKVTIGRYHLHGEQSVQILNALDNAKARIEASINQKDGDAHVKTSPLLASLTSEKFNSNLEELRRSVKSKAERSKMKNELDETTFGGRFPELALPRENRRFALPLKEEPTLKDKIIGNY